MMQKPLPGNKNEKNSQKRWSVYCKRSIKRGKRVDKDMLEARTRNSEDIPSGASYRRVPSALTWGYI